MYDMHVCGVIFAFAHAIRIQVLCFFFFAKPGHVERVTALQLRQELQAELHRRRIDAAGSVAHVAHFGTTTVQLQQHGNGGRAYIMSSAAAGSPPASAAAVLPASALVNRADAVGSSGTFGTFARTASSGTASATDTADAADAAAGAGAATSTTGLQMTTVPAKASLSRQVLGPEDHHKALMEFYASAPTLRVSSVPSSILLTSNPLPSACGVQSVRSLEYLRVKTLSKARYECVVNFLY